MATIVTVKSIQQRLFDINETISGVNASRYFPRNVDSVHFPYIFSLPGRRVRETQRSGTEIDRSTRTFTQTVLIGTWLAKIPIASVQDEAEDLIDTICDTYIANPQLKLSAVALSGIVEALVRTDSGLIPWSINPEYAAIEIPIDIIYNRPIVRI